MRVLLVLCIFITAAAVSCGSSRVASPLGSGQAKAPSLGALPKAGVQPWEKVDSRGYVIPPSLQRGTSSIAPDSYFQSGAERFADGGNVTDTGDALSVSGSAGAVSYAIYRFPMGGQQPGALAFDINLHEAGGKQSQYWVATSDYGKGVWQWSGPYSDGQITKVVVAGSNNLSGSGTFFTAVVADGTAQFDVVGVTVSPDDSADTASPPVPSAPTIDARTGGFELSWTGVLAADLAGYQVYWSYSPFSAVTSNGVNRVPYIENTTRMFLPVSQPRDLYIALSAVDVNGNESAITSPVRKPHPPAAGPGAISVTVAQPSVLRGDPVDLTASGADLYDFDTDGDGVFDITDSASGTATVDTSSTGIIRPRVRAHSSDGMAVAFGSVSLIVSGNQRPVASAGVDPASGAAPLNVDFFGGGTDFDGTIAEYAWDFDGDGVYDDLTQNPTRIYSTPGFYNVKLRVTDDQGAWDVDTVGINVTGSETAGDWVPATPRPAEGSAVGADASMAIVNGKPAISYLDNDTNTLRYVRSSDANGTSWQPSVFVEDLAHDIETSTSLVVVNGNPAIAYYDTINQHLRYERAVDADGTAWATRVDVDISSLGVGQYCSMEIVNGDPAIAYYEATTGNLKFARSSTPDGGTGSWVLSTVDPSVNDVGRNCCLSIIGGKPAISYRDETDKSLYYVRAINATGTSWNPPDLVISPGVDTATSLLEVGGLPGIAYYDSSEGALVFARGFTLDGGQGYSIMTLDSLGVSTGEENSLAMIGGKPAIAYRSDGGQVRYIQAKTADGRIWGQSEDVAGYFGFSPITLLEVGGKPAVCFPEVDLNLLTINLAYWRQS